MRFLMFLGLVLGAMVSFAARAQDSYAPLHRWTVENLYSGQDFHSGMFKDPEESFIAAWTRNPVGRPCAAGTVRNWEYVDWHFTESVPTFPYKNSIADARYNLVECDGSGQSGPHPYSSSSIRHWMCADGEWREPSLVTESEVCHVVPDEPDVSSNLGPPDCDHQCFGDPIHSGNGNKYESRIEYQGASPLLRLAWTYNSRGIYGFSTAGNMLGRGRSTNFSAVLTHSTRSLISAGAAAARTPRSETTVYITRPSGRVIRFSDLAGGWNADLPDGGRLFRYGEESWEYQAADGAAEFFGIGGRLEKIRDADGKSVHLEYDDMGRIAFAFDDQGRSLGFVYDADRLLERLTLPGGGFIQFEYLGNGYLKRVVYPDGTDFKYLYDEPEYSLAVNRSGLLTGEIDERGVRRSTTWYDAGGVAYKTALADGRDTQSAQFSPSSNAKYHGRAIVTGSLGSLSTTDYIVRRGKLLTARNEEACTGCESDISTYTYNDLALVASRTRNGIVETYQYDDAGNEVAREENAAGPAAEKRTIKTVWAPDRPFRLSVTTLDGSHQLVRKEAWRYNSRWQLAGHEVSGADGIGRATSYTYCEESDLVKPELGCPHVGLLRAIDGPRDDVLDVTRIEHYTTDDAGCDAGGACNFRSGDVARITNPVGLVFEFIKYSPDGRPLLVRGADGGLTAYEYSDRGWLISVSALAEDPGSTRKTTMVYRPNGLLEELIEPDGARLKFGYDDSDRLVSVTEGDGGVIRYTLDSAGNRVQEQRFDAQGAVTYSTSSVFDPLGRNTALIDSAMNEKRFIYNADQQVASEVDANGGVTSFNYDGLGRVVRFGMGDGSGETASSLFAYDALDQLTQVTDPKGLGTTYAQNGRGDLIAQVSPDAGPAGFTVDGAGNYKTRTDARGITAAYSYDAANRLVGVAYPDPNMDVGYRYDVASSICANDEGFAQGRLSEVLHDGGRTAYCYDRFGQVVRKAQSIQGVSSTVRYSYNKAGRLASLTYPDGSVADYMRDTLGRIQEIGLTSPGQAREIVVSGVTYAPFGAVTGWNYGNGRQLHRPLDLNYRQLAVHDPAPGGLSLSFGYDPVGSITSLKNGTGSVALARYAYDALGRLTQTQDGATGTPIETYGYDATGNRTALATSAGTTDYSYSADSHHLIAVGGEAREYDSAGNTTSIGIKAFSYNAANRMSAVKQDGSVIERYSYNHLGERVLRMPEGGASQVTVYDETGQWLGNLLRSGLAAAAGNLA